VEDGTHEHLLKNFPNGVYSKLVSQQESIDQQTAAAARKMSRASFHGENAP